MDTISEQIVQLVTEDDIDGLINLINSLEVDTPFKQAILDACEQVFYYWLNALELDKVKTEDHGSVLEVLFDLQAAMEKFAPQHMLRGQLYEFLGNIDKAVEEYKAAPLSSEIHVRLAEAMLTKQQNEEALHHFKAAFTSYSEPVMRAFLHACLSVKDQRFTEAFETALANFAKNDAYVYLEYAKEQPALLDKLKDYDTNDKERLNQLGQTFEKAKDYETALKFYKKGQSINPAAWTFPVYATNVLIQMAKADPSNAIELFEEGRQLFATTYQYEKGFTLVLYWGDFLIEYARFNPGVLKEAEEKLSLAKDLGENYYDHPYRSLAKAALMMGDKQRCLNILQECKAVFSTNFHEYEYSIVLEDEDFREIWDDLRR